MATQILARGARRSTAPTYARVDPTRAQAQVADPELLRKQIFDTTTAGVVGDAYAGNSVAEAFGRGSFTATGQGLGQGGYSAGTGTGSPGASAAARGIGMGVSALGALTGNPSLSAIGGLTGFAGGVADKGPADALGAFGSLAGSIAGVPGGVVGLGRAAMEGNVSLGIDSALSLANPAIGAINAIAGALGLGTIGSFADGLVAKAKISNAEKDPANASRGYGVGFGDNSFGGFGVDGTGSFRGGSNSGNSGGGYGGGIGQSGGNAAGAGSSQA